MAFRDSSMTKCMNGIRSLFHNDKEGYTVLDMVELTGMSINSIRYSARKLCEKGELERELDMGGNCYIYRPTDALEDLPITNEVQVTLKPRMPNSRIVRFEKPYSSPDAIGSHSSLAWVRPAGAAC